MAAYDAGGSILLEVPIPLQIGRMSIQVEGTAAVADLGRRYRKVALPLVIKAIERSMTLTMKVLIPKIPEDRGKAVQSVKPRFLNINSLDYVSGEIYSDSKYMSTLEFGRAPGAAWPPIAPLNSWGRRHGFGPGAGFIIARKIVEQGIEGKGMWQQTYDEVQDLVEVLIGDAIDQAILLA